MRPALVASGLAAIALHGLVLFGLRLDEPAAPLPPAPGPLVVGLVAAAPAPAPEPKAAPPAPEPLRPPEPKRPAPRKPPPRPAVRAAPAPDTAPAEAPTPTPGADEGASGAPGEAALAGRPPGGAGAGAPVSSLPRYRNTPEPEYPVSARRARQEGVVLLAVEVSAQGRPTQVAVKRSSGFESLDRAAVTAVRRWRFEPARTAGLPIASRVEIPVRFKLTE